MDKRLSYAVQQVLIMGEEIARAMAHPVIGSEHILLALLKCGDNYLSDEIVRKGIKYRTIYDKIKCLYKYEKNASFDVKYSIELNEIIEETKRFSLKNKESSVSINSFIFTLINLKNAASDLLRAYGVDIDYLSHILLEPKRKNKDNLGISDLHLMGDKNRDPLIGREKEIKKIIYALARRNKPNAILLGEPGVGKTAIVEEIAKRLLYNEIDILSGKVIYELDIASTVGGTKYRGEFEEKLKKIIKRVKEEGNIILFIDEIHSIVKAGGAEGAIDASNILKPYLARADIQIIGATTYDEFNASFEKDKALKRRFQLINVLENTLEDTKCILYGIKNIYEEYYSIKIDNEVIDYICDKANDYMINQKFPDKAIELLDNSCVGIKDKLKKVDVDYTLENIFNINNHKERLERFKNELDKEIIAQDEMKNKLLSSLMKKEKKIAFVGEKGVGKHKTIKMLIKEVFYDDNIIINSALFCRKQSIWNKGLSNDKYEEMVKLIKEKPSSLIVFEDIDSADKETIHFISNMLENGYVYDDNNSKVISSNCTFIFVFSNDACSKFSLKVHSLNLDKSNDVNNKLTETLGNNFVSLLDSIIEFEKIDKVICERIFERYLSNQNIFPTSDEKEKIKEYIVNNSYYDGNKIIEIAKKIEKNHYEEKIC